MLRREGENVERQLFTYTITAKKKGNKKMSNKTKKRQKCITKSNLQLSLARKMRIGNEQSKKTCLNESNKKMEIKNKKARMGNNKS